MEPTGPNLRVDQFLTNVSIGYRNLAYIADALLPIVPVRQQSGLIPNFDQSSWFRNEAKIRSLGTRSERAGFGVLPPSSYFANRYSFGSEIYDDQRGQVDDWVNLEATSAEFVADKIALFREVACMQTVFQTGVWANDLDSPGDFTVWNDMADSTPLEDMVGWMDLSEASIGREPNTFAIGKEVYNALRYHPNILDKQSTTTFRVATEEQLANYFGVDRLLIGRALWTQDPQGTAEASVEYERIWGPHGLLLYVPAAPAINTPAAGYTFVWARVPNAIQYIKRMRDEEREADIIEGNSYFVHAITSARAGTFLHELVGTVVP